MGTESLRSGAGCSPEMWGVVKEKATVLKCKVHRKQRLDTEVQQRAERCFCCCVPLH